MTEIKDIILLFREEKGLSKAKLGRLLNTSGQAIGQYESGEKKPGYDFLRKWKQVFGFDLMSEVGKVNRTETMVSEPEVQYGGMTIPEQIQFLKRHANFLEFEIMARLKLQEEILKKIDSNSEIAAKGIQGMQSLPGSNVGNESTGESRRPRLDLSNPVYDKSSRDKGISKAAKRAKSS